MGPRKTSHRQFVCGNAKGPNIHTTTVRRDLVVPPEEDFGHFRGHPLGCTGEFNVGLCTGNQRRVKQKLLDSGRGLRGRQHVTSYPNRYGCLTSEVGYAEIYQFCTTRLCEKDVGSLDVPMNANPLVFVVQFQRSVMKVLKRLCNVPAKKAIAAQGFCDDETTEDRKHRLTQLSPMP